MLFPGSGRTSTQEKRDVVKNLNYPSLRNTTEAGDEDENNEIP
jgi:hypothetical protein